MLSADVDLFCDDEDLTLFVRAAGLDRDQSDFYIQVCSGLNFRTSPRWLARCKTIQLGHCTIRIPHPIDILIAKGHAYEVDGSVYYDVTTFPGSGKLSGNTLDQLRAGHRQEHCREGGDRREQNDAISPVGDEDEKTEREQRDDDAHG